MTQQGLNTDPHAEPTEVAALREEVRQCRALIRNQPENYPAYGRLASALAGLRQYREALECYALALQKTPNPYENIGNLFGLGELYKRLRAFEKAAECYEYVLKMSPEHRGALLGLWQAARQQGDMERAETIGERMLALWPNDVGLLLGQALLLPVIYENIEAIDGWRNRLESRVDALLARDLRPDPAAALHTGFFYLGYQGRNDRALAEKIGRLFARILPPTPTPTPPERKRETGKPTIGIVSRHLTASHTIGKLTGGIVQRLSRERFDVRVFALGPDLSNASEEVTPPGETIVLPITPIEEAARRIARERPDILLYPDIGMGVASYCLASMRLAPVQCAMWGHPVTTGLPTIDYFLSSRLLEPDDAAAHYTENLVLLEHLPTCYARPSLPEGSGSRRRFGLDEAAHLYLCPQSLFKFHPDFDPILHGILEQDPKGLLILLSHYSPAVNERLLQRFKRLMPDNILQRIRFLPRLEPEDFSRLLTCADVMLDPLGFGGGNTTYEAMAAGLPVITLPGNFMRGRVTLGGYRQMGLSDCIADNPAHYINLAVNLACNLEENRRVRAAILSHADALFDDVSVVAELEDFFLRSLQGVGTPTLPSPEMGEGIEFGMNPC